MNGIVLIDKPKGWTSFDVVAKIRGILCQSQKNQLSELSQAGAVQRIKVGHTGTLDPMATGLLVILIGNYTKKAPELTKLDKTYEVTMKLGFTSTTGDSEGVITRIDNNLYRTRSRIIETIITGAMKSFVGEIEQVPPAYSAIKVNGQRAYKLARQGKEVKLEPRKVTIYGIQLTDYSYPEVKFAAKVSSGTYIRSLVEDIGKKLGTGAYMSDLRRTKVGEFNLHNAYKVNDINSCNVINLPNNSTLNITEK